LIETPKRVEKAWRHWTSGYGQNPADILKVFDDGAEHYSELIMVRNIPVYSHFAQATEIIHEASGGKHPKEFIWVNVTHAVDGAWGIAGKAYTNAELGAAVSHA
jgi:hypothetical protein